MSFVEFLSSFNLETLNIVTGNLGYPAIDNVDLAVTAIAHHVTTAKRADTVGILWDLGLDNDKLENAFQIVYPGCKTPVGNYLCILRNPVKYEKQAGTYTPVRPLTGGRGGNVNVGTIDLGMLKMLAKLKK